jgi:hypothetical protein
MMRLENDDLAIGKGLAKTGWRVLIVAQGDNVGGDLFHDSKQILPWITKANVTDVGQVTKGGQSLVFVMVRTPSLQALYVLISSNHHTQFGAEGSGLL